MVEYRQRYLRLTANVSKILLMPIRIADPTIERHDARRDVRLILYDVLGIDGGGLSPFGPKLRDMYASLPSWVVTTTPGGTGRPTNRPNRPQINSWGTA